MRGDPESGTERIVTVHSGLQVLRSPIEIEFRRFLIFIRERLRRSAMFDEGIVLFLFLDFFFGEDTFNLRTKC